MLPQPVITTRPLSPRFASLERSLSDNKENSIEALRYDRASRASPRIINKFDDIYQGKLEINNNLSLPSSCVRVSPVPSLSDCTFEHCGKDSGWSSFPLENMSVSLDKTFDSESLSLTSKPLWQELQEAGYGPDGNNGYLESGENHSNPKSTEGKSFQIEKGEYGLKKDSNKEIAHKKVDRMSSLTSLESFKTKAAGGGANKSIENVRNESQTVVSLDSSISVPKNVATVVKDKDPFTVELNNTAVSDLRQTPVESSMERKLIANLPKKLREEAVLRTFANNLRLASSSARPVLSNRQSLEGRHSADSGRESVLEDESRPRLYRYDSSSSVSSVGSTRSALRNSSGIVKPWSVVMMAETIKKRRQDAARKGKQAKVELVSLVLF